MNSKESAGTIKLELFPEEFLEETMDNNSTKKNKKRLSNFTNEMKRQLAAQIKVHPCIWDVNDRFHYRHDLVHHAWTKVSQEVGRPISECKLAWASMRESYRYFTRVSRKGKRDDETIDESCQDEEYLNCGFAEDMSFLPNSSQAQKRKNLQSFQSETEIDESPQMSDCSAQEYVSYCTSASTTKRSRIEDRQSALIDQFGTLIENQRKLQEARAELECQSRFKQPLATFNWLLKRLPDDVADRTCEDIVMLLLTKTKEQREKQDIECMSVSIKNEAD